MTPRSNPAAGTLADCVSCRRRCRRSATVDVSRSALDALSVKPDCVLIDAAERPGFELLPSETLVTINPPGARGIGALEGSGSRS